MGGFAAAVGGCRKFLRMAIGLRAARFGSAATARLPQIRSLRCLFWATRKKLAKFSTRAAVGAAFLAP